MQKLVCLLGFIDLLPMPPVRKRLNLTWATMGLGINSSTIESSEDLKLVGLRQLLRSDNTETMEQGTNNSLTTTESSNVEEDVNNYPVLVDVRPWSDLPYEILEQIGERLGIIEFLNVRGTCREWRRLASSRASFHHHQSNTESSSTTTTNQAAIEQPWFLLYGKDEYPNCSLYNPFSRDLYTKIDIPELGEGVICIASKGGWLLVYNNSTRSLFFFCPFSRAKIELPNLPNDVEGELNRRLAAFSSPPTSPDCVICICTQTNFFLEPTDSGYTKFVLHVIRRGAKEWDADNHVLRYSWDEMYNAHFATISNGVAYFLDPYKLGVSLYLEENQLYFNEIEESLLRVRSEMDNHFHNGGSKENLGLRDIDSLSICGAQIERGRGLRNYGNDDEQHLITYIYSAEIFREDIYRAKRRREQQQQQQQLKETGIMKLLHRLHLLEPINNNKCDDLSILDPQLYKGVWLQPRFFQLPPNYSW